MSQAALPEAGRLVQIEEGKASQLPLSFATDIPTDAVAITPAITDLLRKDAVVAIGVSGGKDSQACALRTIRYLDEIGHRGSRILTHADLGVVEWVQSLPGCQRLADHLKLELVVVRRPAGDMLARWQTRWANNVARYRNLECVRLILPWSTPGMRFCTSEMKAAPIASALKRRFPKDNIISVTGIRRQESAARSKMPISAPDTRLERKGTLGYVWNPIIDWRLEEVFSEIRRGNQVLHEAYTRYGSSRVSCAFCILASGSDLLASTTCAENQDVYIRMCELEAESTFAFQGSRWLADVAPHLLPQSLVERIGMSKDLAAQRRQIESDIPEHLLFTKGWPASIPKAEEAELIASVRSRVSALLNLNAQYLSSSEVLDRYAELMELKAAADARKKK